MSRLLAAAVVGLGVVAALLATPSSGFAHAYLDRAMPAPGTHLDQSPSDIRIEFTEPPDPGFSRIQVLNTRREEVDRGDSHLVADDPRGMTVSVNPGLPDGVYTVAWRTLSGVDGHTAQGAYPLLIGNATAEAGSAATSSSESTFAPESAVARWWLYLAVSLVFGGLMTWRLVLLPLVATSGATAADYATGAGNRAAARAVVAERIRRLVLMAAIALVIGTLYTAVAQAATAADVPLWNAFGRPLQDLLTRGRFAAIWWPRLLLSVLVLALVAWRGVEGTLGDIALAATPAILLTSSLTSHGAALLSGAYLGIAVDWLHFLSVSIWIGGLATLIVALPTALRASLRADRVLARAVGRFSTLALVSVVVIAATGTFQAWLEIGSWEGLLTTAYGQSVLAKVGLLLLMLGLAAFNLLVVRPRLAMLSGITGQVDQRAPWPAPAAEGRVALAAITRRFRRAIRGELALGVLVLAVAAVLTGLAPAREEIARRSSGVTTGPVDRALQAGGLDVRVRITPATIGLNDFAVELPGADPARVERVQLTLTFLDAELGAQPLVLDPAGASAPTTWQASSPLVSQPGQWQADLLVRRTGQDDVRSSLRFAVAGPGVEAASSSTAASNYPLLPSPITIVSYMLMAAGVVVAVVGLRRRGRRAGNTRAAVVAAGMLVVACGGYVYAQEQRNGVPLDVTNVRDPIPPDENSLATGRQIYTSDCEACHGETGRGDGPEGLRLVPRPADLRVHMVPGVHTDGELFYWVSYGFQGTAMPAWKDALTEEQRWDVINYARTLAPQQ